VDAGVYRGSKPHTDADFQFLRSKHIHAILDIRFLPLFAAPEARKARQYGMIFLTSPMNGSPIPPSEDHFNRILLMLRDKRYRPIYFHCDLGRDRTSLIAALYEMYFLNRSRAAAWRDMKHYGFKESWNLRGLKIYFDKHPKPSPQLMEAARSAERSKVASLHDRHTRE
jgi:rhodanese-related sulfurtransferase